MRVVQALGQVCRELRLSLNAKHGLPENDYQAITNLMPYGSGRNWRTLKGFEEGTSNPTHLDDVVLGYSRASGKPLSWIWNRAIKEASENDEREVA